MNLLAPFAILAVINGLSESFHLDHLVESINGGGGQTALSGQFPYQVSVRELGRIKNHQSIGYFRHRCGGSIISRRWIVSAAQCTQVDFSNFSLLAVALGAHHIQNDGRIYLLDRIVNHPAYDADDGNGRNDISLLRTYETIQFNDFVQFIPLRRRFVNGGAVATVSGWGLTRVRKELYRFRVDHNAKMWWSERFLSFNLHVSNRFCFQIGGTNKPTYLQYLSVNTLTIADCRSRHSADFHRHIYNGILCTLARSGQGHGHCHGDEGDPLVSNKQLIGVASWAKSCVRGVPDGYTRIAEFLVWIRKVSGVVAV